MSQAQTDSGSASSAAADGAAMLIRTMKGTITQWSPAMEQRYGFTSDEALGRVSHQLLKTLFWRPRHEIQAKLVDRKSWSGGLIHRHADGRPVMTANRWHLHHGPDEPDSLVSELHSDIVPLGEPAATQLADIMGAVAHEWAQPLAAIGNYISAASRALQPAWPDKGRASEALTAAAGQVARLKEGMALFRELGEALRSTRKEAPRGQSKNENR